MHNDSTSSASPVRFWIFLIFSIPSALCCILILIHFYHERKNLSIHHHLTILLTIISFLQVTTQIPISMAYYRFGEVIPAISAFCTWWAWWDCSLNGIARFTMAWGSIERHLLVFNITLMNTKVKRFVFHILPTLIISIYPLLFYFIAIVLNPCEKRWDYRVELCGAPCFIIDRSNLFPYDVISTIVFPVLIIFIANICLVFRVVYQKRQHHAKWRRQRKLTIQLLGVAFLYILFWIPMAINSLITTFTTSYSAQLLEVNYFIFFVYMVPIFLPFILLAALPELRKRIFRKQQRSIRPA